MAKSKKIGLLFRLTTVFVAFTIFVLIVSGLATYFSQMNIYKKQCERDIRSIGEYLESMLVSDGEAFKFYQEYYMAHFEEVDIPYEFDEYETARAEFVRMFSEKYPGKELGKDIRLRDMDEEMQKAFFIYYHEYWLLTFEQARESFDIPYTYYIVMKEEEYHVVYMIDGERTKKETENGVFLYLGDEYYNDPEVYKIEWDTWFTKEKQAGYQEWNNAWGHTYSYYTPLKVDGETLGLIGTEIAVARVNKEILTNTLIQLAVIASVIVVSMVLLLISINRLYIRKLERLESGVRMYSETKESGIAEIIAREIAGGDEISSLARQFASMITEMENYIRSLIRTTQELKSSQQKAADLNELANKDALTGIRNKTAYDSVIEGINKEIGEGLTRFGIGMVDLNYLKRINDTYGHDRGNFAIKCLCRLVCTVFAHSPVFRIGGDEFVIILRNGDYDNCDELVTSFNLRLEEIKRDATLEEWERISAAIGVAKYDPKHDTGVDSVFKRADVAMYERKQEMKNA